MKDLAVWSIGLVAELFSNREGRIALTEAATIQALADIDGYSQDDIARILKWAREGPQFQDTFKHCLNLRTGLGEGATYDEMRTAYNEAYPRNAVSRPPERAKPIASESSDNQPVHRVITSMGAPDSAYMHQKRAAAYLGIHEDTLRRWIQAGKIPAAKVGRSVLIEIDALQEVLQGKCAIASRTD